LKLAGAIEPQDPALGKHPLDPAYYKQLVDLGFMPTKPHLTDFELAEKLNLALPQLAAVKAAVDSHDQVALEHALGDYLNTRIKPMTVVPTGKQASNAYYADQWLQPTITLGGPNYPVAGTASMDTFELGDDVDWYRGSERAFAELGNWVLIRAVGDAYAETGDPKYAAAMIRFVRSFYRTAGRPPAQRPKTWYGVYGPWRSLIAVARIVDDTFGKSESAPNGEQRYTMNTYRQIGAAPCVTDADRVVFLKIFYETGDYCYHLLDVHIAHNFEAQIVQGVVDVALRFPEFRASKAWLDRCALRQAENLRDCVLDDGGAYERTGYNIGYWCSALLEYPRLRDAGATMPAYYSRRMERLCQASAFLMSPTLRFPLFGVGDLSRYDEPMQESAEAFPQRADFRYLASEGRAGRPPASVTHVLPYTGWLTMRSDWSPQALYLALNFNGNPRVLTGHRDLASFSLWAYGQSLMTNPGTPEGYDFPEYRSYIAATIGSNAVVVDDASQDRRDNSGRLEAWHSLPASGPGFTYLTAFNGSYRGRGGDHRRSVLFLRSQPGYWIVIDRLQGDGKPHDYRWMGHFQPTALSIDEPSKTIATSPRDGKRLWVVPAQPAKLSLERGSGPLVTQESTGAQPPYHPTRAIGPYIALRQKTVSGPAVFAVLLYPSADLATAPTLRSLAVTQQGKPAPNHEAFGFRVQRSDMDDTIVQAISSGARRYSEREDVLETDAEAAYVRRRQGQLVEAACLAGRSLRLNGHTLIEAEPGILALHLRRNGNTLEIAAEGHGTIQVAPMQARQVRLNGSMVAARLVNGYYRLSAGRAGAVAINGLRVSTAAADLCKAVGVPLGFGEINKYLSHVKSAKDSLVPKGIPAVYQGPPNAIAIFWQTAEPADEVVEWRPEGTAWRRMVNPELATAHYYLLPDLIAGRRYQVRLSSRTPDGRVGIKQTTFVYAKPRQPAREAEVIKSVGPDQ
jgi:hypothetical protein